MCHDGDGSHIDIHHLPHAVVRDEREVLGMVVMEGHIVDCTTEGGGQ